MLGVHTITQSTQTLPGSAFSSGLRKHNLYIKRRERFCSSGINPTSIHYFLP